MPAEVDAPRPSAAESGREGPGAGASRWRRLSVARPRRSGLPLAGCLLVACASGVLLVGRELPPLAYLAVFAAWCAGLVCVAAYWPVAAWGVLAPEERRAVVLEGIALFVTALAWRALAAGTLPANLLGDEFSQAREAVRFVSGDLGNMFGASDWYGVPLMYMWLGSLFFRVLGEAPWVWRLVTALAGAGAVAVLYVTVRLQLDGPMERAKQRAAGLAVLAGLFLCFHHLHLLFSRIGSNQGFDALFLSASLLCLVLARRSPARGWWYATGVVAGLGFYFYFALRGIAVLTLGAVAWSALRGPRPRWRPVAWFALGGALAVAPLAAALHGSDRFGGRTFQVLSAPGAGSAGIVHDLTTRTLTLVGSLQGLGLRGWYESGAGLVVSRLELALVALGVIVALRMGRGLWLYPYYLLGILVSVTYLTENPVAGQRITSASVPVAVLLALGTEHVARLVWPRRRALVAAVLVVVIAAVNVDHLFLRYLAQRENDTPALIATELGAFLKARPDIDAVQFCGGGLMDWGSNASLPFVLPDMVVTPTEDGWVRPPGQPGSGVAIVTTEFCPDLKDRLLREPDLEATELLYRTHLTRLEAARMYFDTGGIGYLRMVRPGAADATPGANEMPLFTVFTLRE